MRLEIFRASGCRGVSKLTLLIFAVIVSALIYSAYCIMPFYYYYYDLQNQFKQVIKVASTETDKEIRDKLNYYIDRYEIPARHEDLKIERLGRRMKISLHYTKVFYVTWRDKDYDIHKFKFHAYAEGDF